MQTSFLGPQSNLTRLVENLSEWLLLADLRRVCRTCGRGCPCREYLHRVLGAEKLSTQTVDNCPSD